MTEGTFSAGIVKMTPTKAKRILKQNDRNRSLRPLYVNQLAEAMRKGDWVVNGEPIQIAFDGSLLNGQHRLYAIVESGVTVSVLLVEGLPMAAQKTMDVGARRTLSDVLVLHGEADARNLGAVLSLLYKHRKGVRLDHSNRTAPTVAEALALLEREEKIRGCLVQGHQVHRETKMRVALAALFFFLFEEADPGVGSEFFAALCDPSDEEPGSAVVRLRAHLNRMRSERKYSSSILVLSAMTIKAFNAWREGRPVQHLHFRPSGRGREDFPTIRDRAAYGR